MELTTEETVISDLPKLGRCVELFSCIDEALQHICKLETGSA